MNILFPAPDVFHQQRGSPIVIRQAGIEAIGKARVSGGIAFPGFALQGIPAPAFQGSCRSAVFC